MTMLFGMLIIHYFEKSFLYVAVSGILGLVNTYFMYNDFDFSMISDFRKIDINRTD